jgi:hypothetical protein
MYRLAKFDGRLRKLMKFGEGMQPGTVEWELNKHRQCKEQRENEKQWAQLQATRAERERDPRSLRDWIVGIFRRE